MKKKSKNINYFAVTIPAKTQSKFFLQYPKKILKIILVIIIKKNQTVKVKQI